MSDRHERPKDTSDPGAGESVLRGRASYADPATAAPDAPEQASVLAAGSAPQPPASAPEPLVRQPSDQGGFGAHRDPDSRGDSDDRTHEERR